MTPDCAGLESRELSPWETRRLWSLWDMLLLHAGSFMQLLQVIFNTELMLSNKTGPLPIMLRGPNRTAVEAICSHCDDLHLPITKEATQYITDSRTSEELAGAFLHVKRNMHHELLGRTFFQPNPQYKDYFGNAKLFGEQVFSEFSAANDDIYEAGTCLALERATACVMHLMRVLECGLTELSRALGISQQTDWGAHLRKIAETLDQRAKTAGRRSEDEQFYAEAAANFDRLRRAWRNPTMHPDKSYSQERAEEILLAVRSFMVHLASRISEASPSGELSA
jgi:hypothetical protein